MSNKQRLGGNILGSINWFKQPFCCRRPKSWDKTAWGFPHQENGYVNDDFSCVCSLYDVYSCSSSSRTGQCYWHGMLCLSVLCKPTYFKVSHIGRGDECVCFSCGIKMSNWSEQENVWHRHARMSPHCQLLLQEKGQEFVDSVLEEYGAFRQGGRSAVINVGHHQHLAILFFLCLKFPMSKQKYAPA